MADDRANSYVAIARQRIRTDASNRMPRILVYGRNKKGKTRFCTTAPNVLSLDPEDGTIAETGLHVWPITSWEDMNDSYRFLKTGRHEYEWVAMDGIPRIYNVALKMALRQKGVVDLSKIPAKEKWDHYRIAGRLVGDMLWNFHSLQNIGIVLTAQERMVEITNLDDVDDEDATPSDYMYVADVPKSARSAVNSIVDVIGRLYVVRGDFTRRVRNRQTGEIREIPETLQRRLWVGPHDKYDTGYRSQWALPDFLVNPTVPSVTRAIKKGVKSDSKE